MALSIIHIIILLLAFIGIEGYSIYYMVVNFSEFELYLHILFDILLAVLFEIIIYGLIFLGSESTDPEGSGYAIAFLVKRIIIFFAFVGLYVIDMI